MPSQVVQIAGSFLEGSHVTTVARVASAAEVTLFSSDFQSYAWSVWDDSDPGATTPVASGSGNTMSDVMLSALQNDGYWDGTDTIGYTMRHTVPAASFSPTQIGGHTYRIEYLLTSSTHGVVPVVSIAQCLPMRST